MGAQGTATLDFGSTPTFEASVVVATVIPTGSHAEAFFMRESETEQYDMAPALIDLTCGEIVNNTSFVIRASSKAYAQGSITVRWVWN